MNLKPVIAKAAKRATDEYTSIFQKKALEAGWPPYIVNQLYIKEEDGELFVPPDISAQVDDLEYGTQTASANSVIRTFLNHNQAKNEDFTNLVYADALSDMRIFA
jgi:hypothetical protein